MAAEDVAGSASDDRPPGAQVEDEERRSALAGEPPFKQGRRPRLPWATGAAPVLGIVAGLAALALTWLGPDAGIGVTGELDPWLAAMLRVAAGLVLAVGGVTAFRMPVAGGCLMILGALAALAAFGFAEWILTLPVILGAAGAVLALVRPASEAAAAAGPAGDLSPPVLAAAILDSLVAGFVAFALAGPLIGLRTEAAVGGLSLTEHWLPVGLAVATVVIGRLLLNLFVWRSSHPATRTIAKLVSDEPFVARDWALLALLLAILVFGAFYPSNWPQVVSQGLLGLGVGALLIKLISQERWTRTDGIVLAYVFVVIAGAAFLAEGWPYLVGRALLAVGLGAVLRRVALHFIPDFPVLPFIAGVAVLLAFVLPFLPFANRYVMDQAIVVLTYVMLGWGLNIVVGYAGLLDLGYVAFYAVGAYSYALLSTTFDLSFWVCLPLAGMLAAVWGLILGFPVLRLRGDYLAIVTLAFGEIIRIVLINWQVFTGGPNGINNIPRPSFFGIGFERGEGGFADVFGLEYTPLQRIIFLYYIILVLALITSLVTTRLRQLPVGRAWEALREDEIACRSLGINTTNTKLTAFAVGAMFAGFAGSFFATRQGFISPESFVAMESFIILAVVVLGGLGSQVGIVIAVIFLNTVFELRELAQYRMLIVGASMVLIMVWRPRGLISTRTPSVFLRERRAVPAEAVAEARA